MKYDLSQSPFSRRGSYLQIERGFHLDHPRVMLGSARRSIWRPVRGGGFGTHFFTIQLADDRDYRVQTTPWLCTGTADDGTRWRAAIADENTMLFEADGAALRFAATRGMAWAEQRGPRDVVVCDHDGRCVHHFRLTGSGQLQLTYEPDGERKDKAGAAHHRPCVTARGEAGRPVRVAYCNTEHEVHPSFTRTSLDQAVASAQQDYNRWTQLQATVAPPFEAAAFAWFMLWNQQVPRGAGLTRPAIIMSRFWMNSVWAWDACFNAIALAVADPKLAWDQLLLHMDHQTDQGQVPDSVDDGGPVYGWVKPPVQGWTALQLINALGVEACIDWLPEVYQRLLAWTRWWYAWRCDRTDGLCRYMHGNDSGWDNSSIFAEPGPVISPDLQAFLAVQWKALARIAVILGRPEDARAHLDEARRQTEAMARGLNVNGTLGYIDPGGRLVPSTSTLTRMAIVLGSDLPTAVRPRLIADLTPGSRFVTAFGVATEATDSPNYVADGYWRGPIWAPEMAIAVDGLRRAGHEAVAAELALRFCRTCAAEPVAMFENYNATTGAGLRCMAYSWTAAVFVRLAHWLWQREHSALDLRITLDRVPAIAPRR